MNFTSLPFEVDSIPFFFSGKCSGPFTNYSGHVYGLQQGKVLSTISFHFVPGQSPLKGKHLYILSDNCALNYLSNWSKDICAHKSINVNVYNSFVHNL